MARDKEDIKAVERGFEPGEYDSQNPLMLEKDDRELDDDNFVRKDSDKFPDEYGVTLWQKFRQIFIRS